MTKVPTIKIIINLIYRVTRVVVQRFQSVVLSHNNGDDANIIVHKKKKKIKLPFAANGVFQLVFLSYITAALSGFNTRFITHRLIISL